MFTKPLQLLFSFTRRLSIDECRSQCPEESFLPPVVKCVLWLDFRVQMDLQVLKLIEKDWLENGCTEWRSSIQPDEIVKNVNQKLEISLCRYRNYSLTSTKSTIDKIEMIGFLTLLGATKRGYPKPTQKQNNSQYQSAIQDQLSENR